jgi:hypothetical protein
MREHRQASASVVIALAAVIALPSTSLAQYRG